MYLALLKNIYFFLSKIEMDEFVKTEKNEISQWRKYDMEWFLYLTKLKKFIIRFFAVV